MNTNSQPVMITNYEEIKRYFELFPEQLMQNVSNNESRPIAPLEYKELKQNRGA